MMRTPLFTTFRLFAPVLLAGLSALLSEASAAETSRRAMRAELHRAGYDVVGEARRRGELLIVTATRENISWRLVVDARTGAIIGQRPLEGAPFPPD
jgi:hypothetical protein